MPTLKTQYSDVSGRKEAGDAIVAAAKTQDTKKVRARLAAFTKAHGAYTLAMTKVSAAESVRDLAQRAVGDQRRRGFGRARDGHRRPTRAVGVTGVHRGRPPGARTRRYRPRS